jgi:hypothetical protein
VVKKHQTILQISEKIIFLEEISDSSLLWIIQS